MANEHTPETVEAEETPLLPALATVQASFDRIKSKLRSEQTAHLETRTEIALVNEELARRDTMLGQLQSDWAIKSTDFDAKIDELSGALSIEKASNEKLTEIYNAKELEAVNLASQLAALQSTHDSLYKDFEAVSESFRVATAKVEEQASKLVELSTLLSQAQESNQALENSLTELREANSPSGSE